MERRDSQYAGLEFVPNGYDSIQPFLPLTLQSSVDKGTSPSSGSTAALVLSHKCILMDDCIWAKRAQPLRACALIAHWGSRRNM